MFGRKNLLCLLVMTGLSGFVPGVFAAQASQHAAQAPAENYTPEDIEKLENLVEQGGPDFTEAFFIVFNELNNTYPPHVCTERFARFDRFGQHEWDQYKKLFTLLEPEQRVDFLRVMIMAEQEDFDAYLEKIPFLLSMLQGQPTHGSKQKDLQKVRDAQQKILQEFHQATTHSFIGKLSILMFGFCQGYINTLANTHGASKGDKAVQGEHIPWYARAFTAVAPVAVHASEIKYTAKKILELFHQYKMSARLPVKKRQEQLKLMEFWVTEVGNVLWQHQGVDAWNMWSKDPKRFMHKYEKTIDGMVAHNKAIPQLLKVGASTVASTGLYMLAPAALHYYKNKDIEKKDAEGKPLPKETLQENPHWKRAVCEMSFHLAHNVVLNPLWMKISAVLGHERMSKIELYSAGLVSHDLINFATKTLTRALLFDASGKTGWIKNIADFTNNDTAYLKLYTGSLTVNSKEHKEIVRGQNIKEYLTFHAARYAIEQVSTFCISQMLMRGKHNIIGAIDKIGYAFEAACKKVLPNGFVNSAKNALHYGKKMAGFGLKAAWRLHTAYKFQQNSRGSEDQLMTDYMSMLPDSFLDKQADVAFAKKIAQCLFKKGFNHREDIYEAAQKAAGKCGITLDDISMTHRVPMPVPWKRLIGWGILWYIYNSVESGKSAQDLLMSFLSDDSGNEFDDE